MDGEAFMFLVEEDFSNLVKSIGLKRKLVIKQKAILNQEEKIVSDKVRKPVHIMKCMQCIQLNIL